MKLSTRFAHAKIRLRHSFLKLRVQQSLYYKALAVLVLIFAIGGLLTAYRLYLDRQEPVALGEQDQLDIAEYSISGEVTRVLGDKVEVRTPVLRATDRASAVEYEQRTVQVTGSTEIGSIKLNAGKVVRSEGTLSDITPGKLVAIYTSEDPDGSRDLKALKIEVLEQ
jgi:hypothetical protein